MSTRKHCLFCGKFLPNEPTAAVDETHAGEARIHYHIACADAGIERHFPIERRNGRSRLESVHRTTTWWVNNPPSTATIDWLLGGTGPLIGDMPPW